MLEYPDDFIKISRLIISAIERLKQEKLIYFIYIIYNIAILFKVERSVQMPTIIW